MWLDRLLRRGVPSKVRAEILRPPPSYDEWSGVLRDSDEIVVFEAFMDAEPAFYLREGRRFYHYEAGTGDGRSQRAVSMRRALEAAEGKIIAGFTLDTAKGRRFFANDVYDLKRGCFVDYDDLVHVVCRLCRFDLAPTHYRGSYKPPQNWKGHIDLDPGEQLDRILDNEKSLRNGDTTEERDEIKGLLLRCATERYDACGRINLLVTP